MSSSLLDLSWSLWQRRLAAATAGGVAFAIFGPFGTFLNGGIVPRTAYWVALFWLGALIIGTVVPAVVALARRARVPSALALMAGIALAALPFVAIGPLAARLAWPNIIIPLTTVDWYEQTLIVVAGCVVAALYFERDRGERLPQAVAEPVLAATVAPPQRIPADLLCLQMEDHYVRIHGAGRSELVLLTMRDAIAQVAGTAGLQVHRSWWVAKHAVRDVKQNGRSISLLLINGLEVPVARNRVAELRAKGWMDLGAER